MRKLILLLACLLAALPVLAQHNPYMAFGNGPTEVAIEAYNKQAISLRVTVDGLYYTAKEQDGTLYCRLYHPDMGVQSAYGSPELPSFYRLIAVPEGCAVTVTHTIQDSLELGLFSETGCDQVWPRQPSRSKCASDEKQQFMINSKQYGRAGLYPQEVVRVHPVIRARGLRLLPLSIHPVACRPATGAVTVYPELTVTVSLEGADWAKTAANLSRFASGYSRIYERTALGCGNLATLSGAKGFDRDCLLIITADNQYDNIADYIAWKRKKGYDVVVTRQGDIPNGSTTSGIKAYIQDAYDTWDNPPAWVVLVGDTDTIPTFDGSASGTEADVYFVLLEGGDSFPDASISRICIRSAADMATYLGKLFNNEKYLNPDVEWMDDAALLAVEDEWQTGEGTHNHVVDNYLDPNAWEYDKLYEHTYNANKTQAIASMNAGKMISNYTGHCSSSSWGFSSGIGQSDVNGLTNEDMYFWAIGNCCSSNPFGNTECIGETWIRAENAAIAYWGASNSSQWDEDDILEKKAYEGLFTQELYEVSAAADYGKIKLWEHYGGSGRSQYYMDMYNILGDGTTWIMTEKPQEMVVTCDSAVLVGMDSLDVQVSSAKGPVANAIVSAYGPDIGITGSCRTDGSGMATVQFDQSAAQVGIFDLLVTRANYINNAQDIQVVPPSGPYLVYQESAIQSGAGFYPGEAVTLSITLKNVGSDTAGAIITDLSSTSGYLNITDGSADYNDIPAGGTGCSLPPHFAFFLHDSVPDNTVIPLTLGWSTAKASADSRFSITVSAPDFSVSNMTVDDSSGNGNGIAEPGETVVLNVTVANGGSLSAAAVSGTLAFATDKLTVTTGSVDFGAIPSGGNSAAGIAVQVAADAPTGILFSGCLQLSALSGHFKQNVELMLQVGDAVEQSYASSDVPQDIEDYTTIQSELYIAESIDITEIEVPVNISHTYIGDLTVILQAPDGTEVTLHNGTGSSANDIVGTYGVDLTPAMPLSAFEGLNAAGTWILSITDNAGYDEGSLNSWGLDITGYNGDMVYTAEPVYLGYLREDAEQRSNIGFANLDDSLAAIKLKLYDSSGALINTREYMLSGNSYQGITQVLNTMGAQVDSAYMEVLRTTDSVKIIGGPVDNITSDPSIYSAEASPFFQGFTPLVLKSGGWQTELALLNAGTAGTTVTLSLYDEAGGLLAQETVAIAASAVFHNQDIISYMGAGAGDFGLLRISSTPEEVFGYCRQYNADHTGGIYPVVAESACNTEFTIPYVSDTGTFRSNLGIVNLNGQDATVTVSFLRDGAVVASRQAVVAANQYLALGNIIRYVQDVSSQTNEEGLLTLSADRGVYAIGGPITVASNDPSIYAGFAAGCSQAATPIVLKNSTWQTRVVLANSSDSAISVDLYAYWPAGGTAAGPVNVSVPAKDILVLSDVVAGMGLSTGFYGMLSLDAAQPVTMFVGQYSSADAGGVYPVFPY